MQIHRFLLGAIWLLGLSTAQGVLAQSIPIYSLPNAPAIDGDGKDWDTVSVTTVALQKTKSDGVVEVESIAMKGGTHGNRMFLYLEWADPTADEVHKPWVWNDVSQKYEKGPQREDRLALQFGMAGDFTTNWLSGNEFTADTWHWKASRSNPLGLAHDKSLMFSRTKLARAYKLELPDGGHIYLSRPSDNGDKLYKTKRYRRHEQPMMPKYILAQSPQGSVADVTARGVWSDGKWHLELSRKLVTGNADDVAFPLKPGKVSGGIAVFNRSENDDHAISDIVDFEFFHRPEHRE